MPFGAGDVTQRRHHQRGVAILQRSIKIGGHVLFGFEMLGHIPGAGFDNFLFHAHHLHIACQFQRDLNILILCAFVAACQQDHQRRSSLNEVDPIARAIVDAQF